MKNTVIADTGFWYALLNQRDSHHIRAKTYLARSDKALITTWPVLTETCYLLQSKCGVDVAQRFLIAGQRGLFSIVDLKTQHLARMTVLMEKYAQLPMDLADASLVILAEEIGHGDILSTDRRDFGAYRWKSQHPFNNVLFPQD